MLQDIPQSLIDTTIGIITEKKDHLIRRLKNLTDEQKDEVIAFFKKKPNLENKIDWNRKDLTYEDFRVVMDTVTKTQRKKMVKSSGIRGLKKGEDYIPLEAPEGVDAYIPLNYEASKLIACKDVGSGVGEWCTAWSKSNKYWHSYIKDSNVMIYILYPNTKEAIRFNRANKSVGEIRDILNKEIPQTEIHEAILRKNMREIMNVKNEYNEMPDWLKNAEIQHADYEIKHGTIVVWHRGIWIDGTFEAGGWKYGSWKYGRFGKVSTGLRSYPVWEDGIWEDGIFDGLRWEGGTWQYGTWKNGTFAGGVWINGIWENGRWESGIWITGKIYSKKFRKYVEDVEVNPAEFYEIEAEVDTFEELEEGVQ